MNFGSSWKALDSYSAEREGFEPSWERKTPHPISSRRRYDRFGTSPMQELYCFSLFKLGLAVIDLHFLHIPDNPCQG